jgi:preprotein translocase subunit SecG
MLGTDIRRFCVSTYISLAQIIIAVALTSVIILQSRTSGGLGGIFGGDQGIFRTRRGAEKTLFQFTIILAVTFAIVSLIAASSLAQR